MNPHNPSEFITGLGKARPKGVCRLWETKGVAGVVLFRDLSGYRPAFPPYLK